MKGLRKTGFCPKCGKDRHFDDHYGHYICLKCKTVFEHVDFVMERPKQPKESTRELF